MDGNKSLYEQLSPELRKDVEIIMNMFNSGIGYAKFLVTMISLEQSSNPLAKDIIYITKEFARLVRNIQEK